MKLSSGNQAMAHFIAATTISSSYLTSFASAKGKKVRQRRVLAANKNGGFDPTTPVVSRRNSDSQKPSQQHSFDRPESTLVVNEVLTKALLDKEEVMYYEQQGSLQNNNTSNSSTSTRYDDDSKIYIIDIDEHDLDLDTGVLPSANTAPVETPSLSIKTTTTSTNTHITNTASTSSTINNNSNSLTSGTSCMIGYDSESLLPANDYLQNQIDAELYPNGYGNIVFYESSNSIVCNQPYDLEEGGEHYGCSSMHFKGCNVKCNGKESCDFATIEDAGLIECHGESACREANLDAINIDCDGELACESAIIGDKQFVSMLDCHNGNAACAYAKTYSVGDVGCSGPRSCYGTAIMGVTLRVSCFGLPDSDGYYYPTCGGEGAMIEAADDHHIDVVCDGDFACIGYGHNAYDHKEHPSYLDIDVGKKGSLTCEDNFGDGNHDGDTYVCRYIDIIQGCANYECHAHGNDADDQLQPICNHIYSVHHHEMCTEGPGGEIENDDDDDEDMTITKNSRS